MEKQEVFVSYRVKYKNDKYQPEHIAGHEDLQYIRHNTFPAFIDSFKKNILWDTAESVESIKCFFECVDNDFKRNHSLIKSAVKYKGRIYYGGSYLNRLFKWYFNK